MTIYSEAEQKIARDMRARCAAVAKDRWREWRASGGDDLDGMNACEDIATAIEATPLTSQHETKGRS